MELNGRKYILIFNHLIIRDEQLKRVLAVAPTSKFLKEVHVVKSVRAQNRAVSTWLPAHHTGYCQAVSAFVRFLLGAKDSSLDSSLPPAPTSAELSNLPLLSINDITNNNAVFTITIPSDDVPMKITGRQKACWFTHKSAFLYDLEQSGIPRPTFEWIQSGKSRWNDYMLAFLVKHWNWAKQHGAFSRYSIEPTHNGDMMLCGVLERWLRGRAEEMGLRSRNKNHRQTRKKSSRKRNLYNYRRETVERYLGREAALDFLPHVDCCSDTEEYESGDLVAVGSVWRDVLYEEWLRTVDKVSFKHQVQGSGTRWAARRLDARQKPSSLVDEKAPVASGLPEFCYRAQFCKELGPTQKQLVVKQSNNSESLEGLLIRTRKLLG